MAASYVRRLVFSSAFILSSTLLACASPAQPAVAPVSKPAIAIQAAQPASPTAAAPTTAPLTSAPATPTNIAMAATATQPPATSIQPSATTAGSSPSPAPTQAAAASPATAPAAAGAIKLTLSQGGSQARYLVREQLVGVGFPSDAIGSTQSVSGSIVIDKSGEILREQSKIVVDLRTLKSNESRRDNWIQRNTLETQRFPNAEFVPTKATGLPNPLPTAGEANFQLVGSLTVRGVTKKVTWQVMVQVAGQEVTGLAKTQVKITDFGMTPPKVGPVLSIEDNLKLELDFRGIVSSESE